MALKVLHIGKYFPPYSGGMENYLYDLMVSLSKIGIENSALVHQSDISLTSREEVCEQDGQQLRITRAAVWAKLLFTPISPSFSWLLNRAIKKDQPDILHLHMPNVSVFWALCLPRARKKPWVVHWHSDVLASKHHLGLRLFYSIYRLFERAVLKRCCAIIATSPPYLESSEVLRKYRDKCHIVPLGLDPGRSPTSATGESERSTHELDLCVLAVGRLTYYKGFEYLILALAKVDGVILHLVGKGDQEDSLKALSQRLDLNERIKFCGQISPEQLSREFANCDCLCLPSVERTEAFGMVLLEAMYHRKATIISDVPGSGMGWIVDENVTGLKVPPEDAEKLAVALQHLQQDHARMYTLGQRGREKFDRLFHIDNSLAQIEEIYMQISDNYDKKIGRP